MLTLSGFDELGSDLSKMANGLEGSQVDAALEAGAAPILSRAIENAPRGKTGNLAKALKAGKVKAGKNGKGITIGVHRADFTFKKPNEYYPAYVEYGHGGPHPAGAHPYVRPAYDAEVENAYNIIRQKLGAAIDKNGE